MHHPLQLRYPEWSTRFCVDPAQGARGPAISFLNEHANTGRLIFPAHFPSPTGGTIERDGKAYDFTYCGETTPQIGSLGRSLSRWLDAPYNCSKLLTFKAV